MKIITSLFCFTTILIVFNSCTITKRHFGGGYHVEWKKKWNTEEESVAKKGTIESDTVYALVTPVSKVDTRLNEETGRSFMAKAPTENSAVTDESTKSDRVVFQDEPMIQSEVVQDEMKTNSSRHESVKDVEVKRKVEPLTWVALGFMAAAIALAFMPASIISLSLFTVIFTILLLIAFINAVSSAIRIKRNPEKYKAKAFTWIILFLCSLLFAFSLVVLIMNTWFPAV